jgi:hypothetical protein
VSRADRAHEFEPPVEPPGQEQRLVAPVDLARTRRLPVLPALAPLLPGGGLQRGTTVAVGTQDGLPGATSLALALAAGASQAGSWVAAVGLGALGLVAATELGVALDRLVLVADPGRQRDGWASVVGRLVARARERGAVLMAVGGDLPGERSPVRLTVVTAAWTGLGEGWGHLAGRRMTVETGGRGEAARPRRAELWLPDADGAVGAVEPVTDPIPLHPRAPGAARGRRRRPRGATGPAEPSGPSGPTGPGVVGLPGAPVAGG